jgi:hypothetical protein
VTERTVDVAHLTSEAVVWLRRQLEREQLAGTLAPRIVNPRTQGWIYGFALGLGELFGLDTAKRYELEARLFVAVFEGTPMGEQLGLEALHMAKQMEALPGMKGSLDEWRASLTSGRAGARSFVDLERALDGFRATLA